jgi:hypothetical protein
VAPDAGRSGDADGGAVKEERPRASTRQVVTTTIVVAIVAAVLGVVTERFFGSGILGGVMGGVVVGVIAVAAERKPRARSPKPEALRAFRRL